MSHRSSSWGMLVVALAACGNDHEEPVTWYQAVAPILSEHCVSCHSLGGVAPFSLTDYATAVDYSHSMMAAIKDGIMPPFGARAESECAPSFAWLDDPRLSRAEQAVLQEWIDRDFPIGTPVTIPDPPVSGLADISTTVTPSEGWTVTGMQDEFICYILDPAITEDTWLTGLQVRPGVPEVVHHVIVAEVPPGPDQDQLVANVGIGRPYDCGLSAAVPNLGVYVWTPGTQPLEMRPGVAVPMSAGSKIALQFHYHPHGNTVVDVSSIDLRLSSTPPQKVYGVALIGNAAAAPYLLPGPDDNGPPEFRIPAGVSGHTEHMQFSFDTDINMMVVGPHMHLLGTHLSAKRLFTTSDGSGEECLFDGTWNFDWQRYYTFNTPLDAVPKVAAGEVLDLTCTYDNTMSNPFMSRWMTDAKATAPKDVWYGQTTLDEMCLLIVGAIADAPPENTAKAVREFARTLTMSTARPL